MTRLKQLVSDLKVIRRYRIFIAPRTGALLSIISFSMTATILGLSIPLFLRAMFDYAYPYRDLSLLNFTIIAIAIIYLLKLLLSSVSDYIQIHIHEEISASFTNHVFHTIQKLPLTFHQEKKTCDLLAIITNDSVFTVLVANNILPTTIILSLHIMAILAIAIYVDPHLALITLTAIPLCFFEMRSHAQRQNAKQDETLAYANIASRAQERITNIKTIKALEQEQNESLSFGIILQRKCRIVAEEYRNHVVNILSSLASLRLWFIFIAWYLGVQTIQGKFTLGEVIALMLYMTQLSNSLHSFITLLPEWKNGIKSIRRLDEVLKFGEEDTGKHGFLLQDGAITAHNISFTYASGQAALHNINIKFAPRSITAITGTPESSKEVLVNLLLKFLTPTDGAILVDDQNITEVRIQALRNKIGLIEQNAALFDGTIIDNILYGNEGMERGDAMRSARFAGAHDFIDRLVGGYDSPVGPGGKLLSCGQRQQIAIARTLLRNPKIVIFDESPAMQDAESEYHIHETMRSLRQTKTVIVIARHPSTIKSADTILFLEGNSFTEQGSFEELINKRGSFYRFYCQEFGGLASFHQQLNAELERSARYGSKFCIAALSLQDTNSNNTQIKPCAVRNHIENIDLLLKKNIRLGDSSVVLDKNLILIVLPEIETEQLRQFFKRIQRIILSQSANNFKESDILMCGTLITKKGFKTAEELSATIATRAKTLALSNSPELIHEDDLITLYAKGDVA